MKTYMDYHKGSKYTHYYNKERRSYRIVLVGTGIIEILSSFVFDNALGVSSGMVAFLAGALTIAIGMWYTKK